jgi:hypothetical protein
MRVFIYLKWNSPETINNIKKQFQQYDKSIRVEIIKDINRLNIKNDIIIPDYVNTQYEVFKHLYKNDIYKMLDDKVEFYEFIKNNLTLVWGLHLINTYDKYYNGPDIKKHFIVKNKNSHHGQGNEIINDSLYDLIEKYDEKYQIQDYLYTKCVDAVNLSCLNGLILGAYSYKTFYPSHLVKETNYIENAYIKDFLKSIVKHLNYNGFIEFEFLIDYTDTIYIMECNPRISGCANSYYYFKSVTLPYVNALHTKQIKEINLYEKKDFFET